MENEKGYGFIKADVLQVGKLITTSKSIKYSKLEWAWRIGITMAVVALICVSL